MTNGHYALHTWSHCPDCFSIITSSIPDAVGAAGKPVGVVLSRLIACICAVEVRSKSTLTNLDPPERSPKVDSRMVLVLRSEELARTAYMGVQPTHESVQDSHSSRS